MGTLKVQPLLKEVLSLTVWKRGLGCLLEDSIVRQVSQQVWQLGHSYHTLQTGPLLAASLPPLRAAKPGLPVCRFAERTIVERRLHCQRLIRVTACLLRPGLELGWPNSKRLSFLG